MPEKNWDRKDQLEDYLIKEFKDLILSIYDESQKQRLRVVKKSSLTNEDGIRISGIKALKKISTHYFVQRKEDDRKFPQHKKEPGDTIFGDVAEFMVQLAMPGVVFKKNATSLAVSAGDRLLKRKGLKLKLSEDEWLNEILNSCDLNIQTSINLTDDRALKRAFQNGKVAIARMINKHWLWGEKPDCTVYDDLDLLRQKLAF